MALKRNLLRSTATPKKPEAAHAPAPSLPLLLKIEQVMRELSISRRTVYELVKDGKLHIVRVGLRNSRVRTEEVLKLADANSKPLYIPRLPQPGSRDRKYRGEDRSLKSKPRRAISRQCLRDESRHCFSTAGALAELVTAGVQGRGHFKQIK
jgi:excisionase family DNA binding protein